MTADIWDAAPAEYTTESGQYQSALDAHYEKEKAEWLRSLDPAFPIWAVELYLECEWVGADEDEMCHYLLAHCSDMTTAKQRARLIHWLTFGAY